MFLLRSLFWFLWFQYLKDRYTIRIAKKPEEKEKVYKFRYSIYKNELQYLSVNHDQPQREMIYDEYDSIDSSIVVYSGQVDNITGTAQMITWQKNKLPDQIKQKYQISESIINKTQRIAVIRYLQVKAQHRKKFIGPALISFFYDAVKQLNLALAPDVIFTSCMPGLLPYYLDIGCFTYTDNVMFDEDGILVPLAIAPYDHQGLYNRKGFFYSLAKHYHRLYHQIFPTQPLITHEDVHTALPQLLLQPSAQELQRYRQNLALEEDRRAFDFIISILKKVLILSCKKNNKIITKDVIDFDVYLLVEGKMGVFIDNEFLVELNPGSIVGEMTLFHPEHKRSADVKCITDTKMILIPRNLLAKLEKIKPKDANRLLHILCEHLTRELSFSNKQLRHYKKLKKMQTQGISHGSPISS